MDNKKLYKVMSFQVGQTKNGKEMWRIGLQEEGTENILTGVIWSEDIPRFDGTKFKVGNIIHFLGQDYNSNYNSVVVKNVTVTKEAISGISEEMTNQYLKEINDFLFEIEQKYSKKPTVEDTKSKLPLALLAQEIAKQIKGKEFITTPAAEKYHHNYIGGLLRHTYEVWSIVKMMIKNYSIEKADEVQLAAILHDLGKMCEYNTDLKLGVATIDKEWLQMEISHVHWGYRFAHDCACFDVARMVASHHGKVEWGAIFEPETPEEKLLHFADMLSATIGMTTIDKVSELLDEMEKEKSAGEQMKLPIEEKKEEANVRKTSSDIL